MTKALYKGMEITIHGFYGLYAHCYIGEIEQYILLSDIEVVGL